MRLKLASVTFTTSVAPPGQGETKSFFSVERDKVDIDYVDGHIIMTKNNKQKVYGSAILKECVVLTPPEEKQEEPPAPPVSIEKPKKKLEPEFKA